MLRNRIERLEAVQQAREPGRAFMVVRSTETIEQARVRFEKFNGYTPTERTPVLHIQRI